VEVRGVTSSNARNVGDDVVQVHGAGWCATVRNTRTHARVVCYGQARSAAGGETNAHDEEMPL